MDLSTAHARPVNSRFGRAAALALAVLTVSALQVVPGPAASAAPDGCTEVGTSGPDLMVGDQGPDVLCGRGGEDKLEGRAGDDRLEGEAGADVLVGGPGRDVLVGGDGNDRLAARDGSRDVLQCGAGERDRAFVDPVDVVSDSCEIVEKEHAPPGSDPVAVDDRATLGKASKAITINVLANDSDPDGDTLTVTAVGTAGTVGKVSRTGTTVSYDPDGAFDFLPAGATATDTFTYTIGDGNGGTDTATVTVTITGAGDGGGDGDGDGDDTKPPVAVNDATTVTEDAAAAAVTVLANDMDLDGGPLAIASATDPAHGTVALTGGTAGAHTGLTYAPDADYCNTQTGGTRDTFAYMLNGGSTATVSVTVTCADDTPTAVDDSATVTENAGATAVAVLPNDTDVDGGPKAIASATQPTNGTVVLTGATPGAHTGLTYAPDADYCNNPPGTTLDTFAYTLTPGGSTATVSMTVTCIDDNPTAVDDSATVAKGSGPTAVTVLANDTDTDGGPRTITSATQPTNGTVVLTGATPGAHTGLTYEPDATYCNTQTGGSPDTFSYTLTGGSSATVSITVTCPADVAPVAVDDSGTVLEGAAPTAVTVLTNDTDPDGGPKAIASATQPAHGTVVLTGGTAGARTGLTYLPDPYYCNAPPGTTLDPFTYTLTPGGSTATVSMTVTCVDNDPTAINDTATVAQDAIAAAVDVLANDIDIDGGPKTITSAIQPTNGTVVLTGATPGAHTGLTYEPDAGYCNSQAGGSPDTFTYLLNGGSAATVSVTVTCHVDIPPVAVADGATVAEDAAPTAVPVLTNDTDPDAGPQAIASATQPTNGTVALTGGTPGAHTGLTYKPAANYCNSPPGTTLSTFTYTLTPGGSTASVSMTVTCVDDNPVAVNDSATVAQGAAASAVTVLANDTDVDGGPKAIGSATQPTNGTVVLTGGSAGAHTGLTYAPTAGYCNNPPGTTPDTFTYTLNGGSTATVSVNVTCQVDNPPVGVADSATVAQGAGSTAVPVLANDADLDGGPMAIASTTQPTNGTVVLTGGSAGAHTGLTYAPTAGYCNSQPGGTPDTFVYTLNGGSTATVSITVVCAPPNASPTDAGETYETNGNTWLWVAQPAPGTAKPMRTSSINLLDNATDPDTPATGLTTVNPTQGAHGEVSLHADGSFLYIPDVGYTGPDSFTYQVSDGTGTSAPSTVNITVDRRIWYVSNAGTPFGDGTSGTPFQSLEQADLAATAANDIIYVRYGIGGDLLYDTDVDLMPGQQLLGEGVDLVVGGVTLFDVVEGSKVPLIDLTVNVDSGNTVRGLWWVGTHPTPAIAGNAGDNGGTIMDVLIQGGRPGIELVGTTGDWTFWDVTVDVTAPTGYALRAESAGVLTFRDNGTNAFGGNVAGAVKILTTVTTGSIDTVTAEPGSTAGIEMLLTGGDLTFGTVNLTTSGTAVALSNADKVTVGGGSVTSTGGNFGISLVNSSNYAITIPSGSLSGQALVVVQVIGGTGTLTYGGSIGNLAGLLAVAISNHDSGEIRLTGPISSNGAISVADGSAPVAITHPNNVLNSGGQTALSVTDQSVSPDGMTFRSLSSIPAPGYGLFLQDTTGGPIKVTGSGTAGSGGTIRSIHLDNTAGRVSLDGLAIATGGNIGIEADNARSLVLRNSSISGSGTGITLTATEGLHDYVVYNTSIILSRGLSNRGIELTNPIGTSPTTNIWLLGNVISGTEQDGIALFAAGTARVVGQITDNMIENYLQNGLWLINTGGTADTDYTVTGNTITDTFTGASDTVRTGIAVESGASNNPTSGRDGGLLCLDARDNALSTSGAGAPGDFLLRVGFDARFLIPGLNSSSPGPLFATRNSANGSPDGEVINTATPPGGFGTAVCDTPGAPPA